MGIVQAFNTVIHVPRLSVKEHLRQVLQEVKLFDEHEIKLIEDIIGQRRLFVGIKKLLMMAEMAVQTNKRDRVDKFVSLLEDEDCLIGEVGLHWTRLESHRFDDQYRVFKRMLTKEKHWHTVSYLN